MLEFTKIHGLGNDYIYLDGVRKPLPSVDLPSLAREMSDRHFGVGGDGIILVLPAENADFRMRIFNADGSEAEMCGNGIRGFAKYVVERGYTTKEELAVETMAGLIRPRVYMESGRVKSVRVDMGEPRLAREQVPMRGHPGQNVLGESLQVGSHRFDITALSMGNPHCVIFVDEDLERLPVRQLGPQIETHRVFPERTNVEFVRILNRNEVAMRVWERGSGETMACGTGACAVAVATALNGRGERHLTVHLRGGDLDIEWGADNHVYMTGPAREVFHGTYDPR